MTKRIIAIILAALMIATLFASCNNGEQGNNSSTNSKTESQTSSTASEASSVRDLGSEDNIELTVWGPATQQDILKKQVEEFKALYPDKKMTINVGVSEENVAKTDVLNDIEAAADIFSFPSDHLQSFVEAGALSAVQYYGDVTAANAEASVSAATLDNVLYAYPLTADNTYVMFYDKSIYSEEDVKSLDTMCQKAKDAGKKVYVDAGNGFYSCAFSFTGGLKIEHDYDKDIENHTFTSGEDTCVAALQAFGKLFVDGGFGAASVSEGISGFASGKAAAVIDGTWDAAAIKDILGDNMGVVELPSISVNGKDMHMVSLFGYKFMGVKANTKFKNTAHALAEFLSGEKCQSQKAEQLSITPSNKNVAASSVVTSNPITKAVSNQLAYSIPQTSIAGGFWNAQGAVGTYLSASGSDLGADAVKTVLDDCITATNES